MALSAVNYLTDKLWGLHEQELSSGKSFCIKAIKLCLLAVEGFTNDLCRLRASALTLYTLLSIVPVIALLFGVAKGFGFEKMLKTQLLEQVPEQETMIIQLLGFAENLLANTQGGVVAGIGVTVLFWTVIKVIGNIEDSFNEIWKIKQGRTWSRKVSDYLSLMLLAPVLLIAAGSITVFVKTQITWLMNWIQLPELGTMIVLRLLSFSPLLLMTALFSFVFVFMPNHKIQLKAGVVAGFITAVLYQLLQWGYLSIQIGVSSYNAIYGSFAALPLFLIWLQIGWIIVLFGCEMSFYIEHYQNFKNNKHSLDLSFASEKVLALQIMHFVVRRFRQQQKATTELDIVNEFSVPLALVQIVLQALLDCALIVQIKTENDAELYQPAMDSSCITVTMVINALEKKGMNALPVNIASGPFADLMSEFNRLVEQSNKNILLIDLE